MTLAERVEPQLLADHPLVFAVPVLVPALVVVLLVVLVVVRDRRRGELDDLDLDPTDPRRSSPEDDAQR